jgi:hypothetical protein
MYIVGLVSRDFGLQYKVESTENYKGNVTALYDRTFSVGMTCST